MAEWKNEVLNWAEEHSDGQRELKVWRELITEYLEEEYLKEDGMSDEEFKQFLIEQESWETMAEDYMEATGYSLYDRDGNIVISDAILEYYEAFKGSQISLTQPNLKIIKNITIVAVLIASLMLIISLFDDTSEGIEVTILSKQAIEDAGFSEVSKILENWEL